MFFNLAELLQKKSDPEVIKKAKQLANHSFPKNLTDWEKEIIKRHEKCLDGLCSQVHTKGLEEKDQKGEWAFLTAKAWLGHIIGWCESETNANGPFDYDVYTIMMNDMGRDSEEELEKYKHFYNEYNMMAFNFKKKLMSVTIKKSPLGIVPELNEGKDENRIQ